MNENSDFVDILKPRHGPFGIFRFMTRSWVPKKTLVLDKYYTPQELRDLVVNSVYMDIFLNAESAQRGIAIDKLKKEMLGYLDEMAFEKKLHVVRWVGMAFLKICSMMKIRVFVNEPVILQLRESMGNNPVLFLPAHRSYVDFCVMTYLCYHYDIALPAVAAGIDFHSMAVVGQRLREMCAFYIRRTLVGAPLYAATLQQYVRTVVAHHYAPIEFFIEGTRSRSNKSLVPRIGMLSMALLPYFAREVVDITIVPVTISYDRLVELTLFSYEHLGVPKPRESTEGLLRSLQCLNDDFGSLYINLGTPISLNEYLEREVSNTSETLNPVDLQVLTEEQTSIVQDIADHVVASHQVDAIVTIPTLMSMVLMESLMKNRSLHIDEVVEQVQWLAEVLDSLGARVIEQDVKTAVDRMLVVHRRMFTLDSNKHFKLVSGAMVEVTSEVRRKMKGHTLKAETMMKAVPVIELQTYVNPALHYLVPAALIYLLVRRGVNITDICYKSYLKLREMLQLEFFYVNKNEDAVFLRTLEYCTHNRVITSEGNLLSVADNERLQFLLEWAVLPTLTALNNSIDVLLEVQRIDQMVLLRLLQARAEERGWHPYTLSLDLARHCVRALVHIKALILTKRQKEIELTTVPHVLQQYGQVALAVMPQLCTEFGVGNAAVANRNPVASRL